MAKQPRKSDQFEDDADAIKGGGATTDRGHRDMGSLGSTSDSDSEESTKPTSTQRDDFEKPKSK